MDMIILLLPLHSTALNPNPVADQGSALLMWKQPWKGDITYEKVHVNLNGFPVESEKLNRNS